MARVDPEPPFGPGDAEVEWEGEALAGVVHLLHLQDVELEGQAEAMEVLATCLSKRERPCLLRKYKREREPWCPCARAAASLYRSKEDCYTSPSCKNIRMPTVRTRKLTQLQ